MMASGQWTEGVWEMAKEKADGPPLTHKHTHTTRNLACALTSLISSLFFSLWTHTMKEGRGGRGTQTGQ